MAKKVFLEYYITLTDAAAVVTNINADSADPRQALMSPMDAARAYTIPISDPEGRLMSAITPASLRQVGPVVPPAITSSWFYSKENFPIDQTGFKRKSGGWFGISFLFGTTTYYYWHRNWIMAGDAVGAPGLVESALAQRRWIMGFEGLDRAETNGQGASDAHFSREASRHVGGMGYQTVNDTTGTGLLLLLTCHGGPANQQTSWERIYVRPKKFPSTAAGFWRPRSTPSPSQSMILFCNPDGSILVQSSNPVGTLTPHATAGNLTLNAWNRLDLLLNYRGAGAAGSGRFEVWVNGVRTMDLTGPLGLDENNGFQTGSVIGRVTGSDQFGLEMDYDDWFNSELPTTNPSGARAGRDWRNGSSMRVIRPTGIATLGGYAGDWRSQLQIPATNATAPASVMTSSTAVAVVGFTTDAAKATDAIKQSRGVAALVASVYALHADANNGRVGYKFAGGIVNWIAANYLNAGAFGWVSAFAPLGGVVEPRKLLAGLEVHVEHPAGVGQLQIGGVFAVAELLGRWGNEDPLDPAIATPPAVVRGRGPHAAPYPESPWAAAGAPPVAPYAIIAGTYVGTGVPRDLTFDFPVTWLMIRRTAGLTAVCHWWSSMVGAHLDLFEGIKAQAIANVRLDPAYQSTGLDVQETKTLVTLTNNIATNEVGVTYQYVAVADPGGRFMWNDAFAHAPLNLSHDNNMVPTGFLPEAAFFQQEQEQGVVARMWFKGLGHGSTYASQFFQAENSNVGSFAAGKFTSRAGIHVEDVAVAANYWRRNDGSGDAGASKAVQLGSYTGDGTASRVIPLTPASGVRPVYAMVVPHNNTAPLFRDPSHTGTTSTEADGDANAATGIIAGGIDAITVGVAANAAGVVYEVFALPGSDVAGNGGWSGGGTFTPIDPATDYTGGGWDDPFIDFPDFEGPNPFTGAQPPDLDDDLSTACSPFTHRMVNIALARIGVTAQITSMGTEITVEAAQARLHYLDVVEQVLRDFPWPFATRYEVLTLVAGTADTPVNGDWQYAYARPARMVFARRIVRPGTKRLFDPQPPPFRVGNDDTADRIYTDEVDPELEYTTRPVCAAGSGDALFREALSYRLAHAFCQPFARDEKTTTRMWQMYLHTLERAKAAGANEQQQQNVSGTGDADWIQGRN